MSLSEEFQKRQAEKPDQYTLAWWRSEFQEVLTAYRGINHASNKVLAYNEDLEKANKVLLGRIQALEAASEADRAKIGELLKTLAEFTEAFQKLLGRVDRQGEFLNQLKQKKG